MVKSGMAKPQNRLAMDWSSRQRVPRTEMSASRVYVDIPDQLGEQDTGPRDL
jgi:hypothetical protein